MNIIRLIMETHVKMVIYDEISYLDRILHILMIRTKFVFDIGLLNGKMGIVIAFAHLYSDEKIMDMLKDDPDVQNLYRVISESIQELARNADKEDQ